MTTTTSPSVGSVGSIFIATVVVGGALTASLAACTHGLRVTERVEHDGRIYFRANGAGTDANDLIVARARVACPAGFRFHLVPGDPSDRSVEGVGVAEALAECAPTPLEGERYCYSSVRHHTLVTAVTCVATLEQCADERPDFGSGYCTRVLADGTPLEEHPNAVTETYVPGRPSTRVRAETEIPPLVPADPDPTLDEPVYCAAAFGSVSTNLCADTVVGCEERRTAAFGTGDYHHIDQCTASGREAIGRSPAAAPRGMLDAGSWRPSTPHSAPRTRGPNCKKGCRCGNACIDCSKRCHK